MSCKFLWLYLCLLDKYNSRRICGHEGIINLKMSIFIVDEIDLKYSVLKYFRSNEARFSLAFLTKTFLLLLRQEKFIDILLELHRFSKSSFKIEHQMGRNFSFRFM